MIRYLRSRYHQFLDFIKPKYPEKLGSELKVLEDNWHQPNFDFSVYVSKSTLGSRLVGWLFNLVFRIARFTGWIKFPLLPFKILARSSDVKAAFEDNINFKVPFGPEMKAIAGPETFGLGLDNEEHKMQRAVMEMYMRHDREVAGSDSWAELGKSAGYILDDSGGRIDAMSEFAIPLISEACLKRFGLECPDPLAFAQWNIAVSIQIFASPTGSAKIKLQQLAAASRNISNCIEHSMRVRTPPSKDTLLGFLLHLRQQPAFPVVDDAEVARLLAAQSPATYLSDDRIRAIVAGMVSGFVPTTSLGSGNLLKALGDHPEWMEQLSRAAARNDKIAVRDIILEAARFKPAGDPGHFRIVPAGFSFNRGGKRNYKFQQGDLVLLSTPQAMMDPHARENPKAFKPGHRASPDYMFGHIHHSCLGMQMATEVMTELFLQLFSRPDIKLKADKHHEQAGPFPWKRPLTFRPDTPVTQSMITVGIPVSKEKRGKVEALLNSVAFQGEFNRNDASTDASSKSEVALAFDSIELIHNASICLVDLTRSGKPASTLLLEFNTDGEAVDVFRALDENCPTTLRQLVDLLGKPASTSLRKYLKTHLANLRQRPWGHIGLGFNGIGDFPVQQIKQEQKLYTLLEPLVQKVGSLSKQSGNPASQLLSELRAVMRGEKSADALRQALKQATTDNDFEVLDRNVTELQSLGHLLHRPARRIPKIADHTDKTFFQFLLEYLKLPKVQLFLTSLIWIPFLVSLFYSLHKLTNLRALLANTLLWAIALGLLVTVFLLARIFMQKRALQIPEFSYDRCRGFVSSLRAYLNQAQVRQFLIRVVWIPLLISFIYSIVVPAPFWKVMGSTFVLTGAMTVIFALVAAAVVGFLALRLRAKEKKDAVDESLVRPEQVQAIQSAENRPGLIQNQLTAVNTLKKGRFRLALLALGLAVIYREVLYWFRSGFVVDIGTIRHAKWFRLAGTDQLIFQANFDGSWESYLEDFSNKAFQGQNAVWSHCEGYPRTRFMTFEGAHDGDNFKRWVRGKQVRTHFWYNRFPDLSNAHIRRNAMIRDGLARASTATEARAWLSYFGSQPGTDSRIEDEEVQSLVFNANKRLGYSACIGLQFEGDINGAGDRQDRKEFLAALLSDVASRSNSDAPNGDLPTLGFGDCIHKNDALYVAFSHRGLRCLGLQDADQNFGLSSFSPAFVNGMANRQEILGDVGRQHPEHWQWSDSGSNACQVDVVLFPMADSADGLGAKIDNLTSLWKGCAKEVVHIRTGTPEAADGSYDATSILGFRDGISQPVVKGTYRHGARKTPEHDVMDPGEIILGYRDNKAHFPLTPKVEATRDLNNCLADMPKDDPGLYVPFGNKATEPRDLGRNGTYLVLRQLEIDSSGFNEHMNHHSAETGIPSDTLKAKIMGRWPSGAPLVRYPDSDPGRNDASSYELNNFLYGDSEDPQGNRCPLGSHIRRANPRDSLGVDRQAEIKISNRHRILRRGRKYHQVWFNGNRDQVQKSDDGRQYDAGDNEYGDSSDHNQTNSEGLLFVAMNANIERQFEFVQQTWIAGRSFHGLDDKADPLLGAGEPNQFSIPASNGSVTLNNLQSYSRVRGGGYYFMPSYSMLRYLADLP